MCISISTVLFKDRGWANYGPKAKSGPLPVFVNKVLWAHSLAYSPIYHLGMCSHCNGKAESLQRDLTTCKVENIHCLAPGSTSLPTPDLINKGASALRAGAQSHSRLDMGHLGGGNRM